MIRAFILVCGIVAVMALACREAPASGDTAGDSEPSVVPYLMFKLQIEGKYGRRDSAPRRVAAVYSIWSDGVIICDASTFRDEKYKPVIIDGGKMAVSQFKELLNNTHFEDLPPEAMAATHSEVIWAATLFDEIGRTVRRHSWDESGQYKVKEEYYQMWRSLLEALEQTDRSDSPPAPSLYRGETFDSF